MVLQLTDVQKSFGSGAEAAQVLRGVSFELDAGETLALTGESGSGKSTLLHLIGGLEAADGGRIEVLGHDLAPMTDVNRAALRRDGIGIVFQQFNLIPSLTVEGNLSFQARLSGKVDADWSATLAERLGLADLMGRYPEQLSGGQQQRVAIGRALAGRPRIVLADEPTGNLDEDTADAVMSLMVDLVDDTGAALLVVTHSDRLAARMSRRIHLTHGMVS